MRKLAFVAAMAIVASACGGTPPTTQTSPSAAPAGSSATAAPRLVSLKINYTAISGASSGLWTAFEGGYFKDENLDVELVNVASSTRAVPALIAKDVQFSHLDGQVVVDAVTAGAKIKMISAINNKLVFSIMTKADIKKPEDLKGKKIGITTPGSSTHTATLLALRMWGLVADKDVALVGLSEVPNILAGLIAGQVDAGTVSPPTNTRAKAAGFNELLNLGKDGPEWPSVGVGATAEYLQQNPDVAPRVIKAYARGTQRFISDKAFALKTLQKYLKLDDQAVLTDTWEQYSLYLAQTPYVLGMQSTIDVVAATNAKAKGTKPEDYLDMSYVKKLDDEGFFKKLFGR